MRAPALISSEENMTRHFSRALRPAHIGFPFDWVACTYVGEKSKFINFQKWLTWQKRGKPPPYDRFGDCDTFKWFQSGCHTKLVGRNASPLWRCRKLNEVSARQFLFWVDVFSFFFRFSHEMQTLCSYYFMTLNSFVCGCVRKQTKPLQTIDVEMAEKWAQAFIARSRFEWSAKKASRNKYKVGRFVCKEVKLFDFPSFFFFLLRHIRKFSFLLIVCMARALAAAEYIFGS